MAVNIKELKPGNAYTENNDLFLCISNDQNKQGRLSGKYMVKRKNMRTSAITEVSYNPTAKVDLAMIEKRKMQYLYGGSEYCFMDMETYEQVEIPAERLEWESKFLLEGMNIEIVFYGDEILGVNLPEKVSLEVTEASPAVAGNTATNALKEVKLETGLVVKVPMFIEQGDHVIVSTWDGKYNSRG